MNNYSRIKFHILIVFLIINPSLASAAPKSIASSNDHLASPEEIKLGGSVRREEMNSPLGTISLRWPRTAETFFGRTPVRAMADAARTVSRVLKLSSFPSEVQNMNIKWNVVFMDENLPEGQIPTHLISNCHPGWMTPPGNIYIVAQRIAAGCGGGASSKSSVADSDLTEVLIHEMGHAVEALILKSKMYGAPDSRLRAEGFATWFETYASQYSSILNQREIKSRTAKLALTSLNSSPKVFNFSGSAYDYARASMYFSTVEQKYGLRGISRLYLKLQTSNNDLLGGINAEFGIKGTELELEVQKVAERLAK